MKNKIKKIIKENGLAAIIWLPFICFYMCFFFNSFFNLFKTQIAGYWTPVTAEINLVSVNYEKHYSAIFEKKLPFMNVVTKYTYKMNDKIIFGDKIAFGYNEESFDDKVDMEIFNKLKNCRLVKIYVNPNNENESVIASGINDSIFRNFIYTLMWGTLISLFIIPILLKQNNMLKPFFKIYYFIILILLIIGIFPSLTKSLNFSLIENIKIIEQKIITY